MERTDTSAFEARPRGEPGDVARFFVEEPERAPRMVALARGRVLRVGRGEDQDVRLFDQRSSRAHAQLAFERGRVSVRDLGSSNGTWVDERRLTDVASIQPGAVVRVGGTRIVYVPAAAAARGAPDDEDVVAVDPASVQLFSLARRLGASEIGVLLQGETGVGKEVVARALHRHSRRAASPFVAINCASLPESIAESELFGHERGSFTGAYERKVGVFESADRGVLLLDEVGDLSPPSQARLLRVLQERTVVRVGATRGVPIDVRVLCATNRNLAAEVARGRFREDLYFRLNGVTVTVPPLRDRPGDIVPHAERAVARSEPGRALGPGFAELLCRYRWPGNVRELLNAVECAAALAEGDELLPEHLPLSVRGLARASGETGVDLRARVDEVERASIVAALDRCRQNQSHAAVALGISRRALIYKMERFGLKAPPRRPSEH